MSADPLEQHAVAPATPEESPPKPHTQLGLSLTQKATATTHWALKETGRCLIDALKNPTGPEASALKAAAVFGYLFAELTSGGWHLDPDWSLVRYP